ncbi:hypothetical protein J7L09_01815 [bacterium]|nr:hypothetical protein [bacterium]
MSSKSLIQQIESFRNSKIIAYITSDRKPPVGARIAMDVIPVFSKQLRSIGKVAQIDLFLYSTGGDTMVPWRLVSMIREYCDKFSVLIPYKAHSAATMIALGADEIVMSDLSELSPIDPSTANVFNPQDPRNLQARIPISVEDVMAYFDLAKNKIGIKDEKELTEIFKKFIESNPQIHPLALGNVNRVHNLIRILAKRLLKSHKKPMSEEEINKIVDYLTEKLYSHQYFIGRKEAKEELGIKTITYADDYLSNLMSQLLEEYKKEMELDKIWNPEIEIGENQAYTKKSYKVAFIESTNQTNYFEQVIEFKKGQVTVTQQTPQGPIQIPQEKVMWRVIGQGWK